MSKPFLSRSIRPEPAPFTLASLQRDWTCPKAAEQRQADFDRWSAEWDRKGRERWLLEGANLHDEIDQIMGDRK